MKQANIAKSIKAWLKSTLAIRLAAVNTHVDKLCQDAKANNVDIIVVDLDLGADGKLAKKVHETLKASIPTVSSVIVTSDDDEEKYVLINIHFIIIIIIIICTTGCQCTLPCHQSTSRKD